MTGKRHVHPIIQGKLFPATGTRKPLPRPRLDSSSDVLDGIFPVVVVAAPAGYGKSTLMARWHAKLLERGVSCAWLSLDEDDNDATRFLRHLIAALQKASARIGKEVAEDLVAEFASGSRSMLEAIAGDLAQVQHRVVLFLDDLQLVEEPEVRGILDWLVNYAPRPLQYVIGTRQDPGLRLSGLRVRSQLLELGAEQLQFDAAEAAQFYRSRRGRDLTAPDLQTLLTKTEGWPAALELAALVLAGSSEPKTFIQHFAGTDTSVVDYLCDMVLSQVDERTRDIVFRISMFDRICAPLARAVTDANDAEEALLGLRTRNLFLIPLDRSWEWVRFHQLAGEFFRETYRRTAPSSGGNRSERRSPPHCRRPSVSHPYPVRLCALVLSPVSGIRSADLPPAAAAPESRGASASRRRRDRHVALLKQSPRVVVAALDAAIENGQQRELAHRSVELLILRALAEKEDGDWASALADVHRALTIAAPRNYVRVFVDEGRELAALIDRLDMEQLRGSEAAPLARRLRRAMYTPDVQGGAPTSMGEELTKRELSILKRLETGLSNKEIAEAIFVSEGTLKWHLHNVYSKLNVKNRTGAMARGRALGIL